MIFKAIIWKTDYHWSINIVRILILSINKKKFNILSRKLKCQTKCLSWNNYMNVYKCDVNDFKRAFWFAPNRYGNG